MMKLKYYLVWLITTVLLLQALDLQATPANCSTFATDRSSSDGLRGCWLARITFPDESALLSLPIRL